MPKITITCGDFKKVYSYPDTQAGQSAYLSMLDALEELKNHNCNNFEIERGE